MMPATANAHTTPPMAATGKASAVATGRGVGVVVVVVIGLLGDVTPEAVLVVVPFFRDVVLLVVVVVEAARSGPIQPPVQVWSCSPLMPVQ